LYGATPASALTSLPLSTLLQRFEFGEEPKKEKRERKKDDMGALSGAE
jgi:hypothetical protein